MYISYMYLYLKNKHINEISINIIDEFLTKWRTDRNWLQIREKRTLFNRFILFSELNLNSGF